MMSLFTTLATVPQGLCPVSLDSRIHWLHLCRGLNSPNKSPVGWGSRIDWLHLCREVRPPPTNEFPKYDTKQSDGEAPVMLELWGMRSTSLLPSLPGPLWPAVVTPDRILSMSYIELNSILMLNWIPWNRIVLTFKLHTYAKLYCLK